MDRAMLEDHLRLAIEHVAEGEQHVQNLGAVLARLEEGGHDTTEAKRLLAQFEELQAMHGADRDRLLRELGDRD